MVIRTLVVVTAFCSAFWALLFGGCAQPHGLRGEAEYTTDVVHISEVRVRNISGYPLSRLNGGPFTADQPTLAGSALSDYSFDFAKALRGTLTKELTRRGYQSASGDRVFEVAISRWDQSRLANEGTISVTMHGGILDSSDKRLLRNCEWRATYQVVEKSFVEGVFVPVYSTRFSATMEDAYQRIAEHACTNLLERLELLEVISPS